MERRLYIPGTEDFLNIIIHIGDWKNHSMEVKNMRPPQVHYLEMNFMIK